MSENPISWSPGKDRAEKSAMFRFMTEQGFDNYAELYRWSIDAPERFWLTLWSFAEVRCERRGDVVLVDGERMPGARWFPEARLNFAANLLRRRDESMALLFRGMFRKQAQKWFDQFKAYAEQGEE